MLGNSSTLRREYELLEQLSDSIVVVDTVGNILLVNKSALQRWRYQSEQLLGESIFLLLEQTHSDIAFPFSQLVGKRLDAKLRQGDGEYRRVVMSVSKLSAEQQTHFLFIVKYSYPLALPRSVIAAGCRPLSLSAAADPSGSLPTATQSLSLVDELRYAIDNQQLELYFQPQLDVSTGALCGVESLCRWFHRHHGMIPPDKFIALAESVGMIGQLDLWVLRQSCQQLLLWRQQGLTIPVISVNLSSVNLRNSHLAQQILSILKEAGLTTADLMVEITESGFVGSEPVMHEVISQLHHSGIQLSVDDFGVGYSNLRRLQTLPIRQLKLDRSLIEHIDSSSVAKSISAAALQIGNSMQLQVVAEGVETDAQYQILKNLGFHVVQGYLFSAPLNVQQFERWAMSR